MSLKSRVRVKLRRRWHLHRSAAPAVAIRAAGCGHRLALAFMLTVSLGAGCGDDDAQDGGAPDGRVMRDGAGLDGEAIDRDATIDSGIPACMPTCSAELLCCGDEGSCIDPRSDAEHCGRCDLRCADGRGTECRRGRCVCGGVDQGCVGTRESTCCPPRGAGQESYCANIEVDGADCGQCGRDCDPAKSSRCTGGRCVCGGGREPCADDGHSLCCADITGTATCVDSFMDASHCGACDVACEIAERCDVATCTRGTSCPAGCAPGTICCDGQCCSRSQCNIGRCGEMDAGAPDGGVPTDGSAI